MHAKLNELMQSTNNGRPINLRVGVMSAFDISPTIGFPIGFRCKGSCRLAGS